MPRHDYTSILANAKHFLRSYPYDSGMGLYAKKAVKNLRKMIVDSGLPSAKVALGAGIHEATISKYLSGEREPRISILEKVAEYLKRDFQDFFR